MILMEFSTFREKLSRLNRDIYIHKNATFALNKEWGTSGIYLKNRRREKLKNIGVLEGAELESARKHNADDSQYIGWTARKWVPEGNKYDEEGRLIAPGWRSILIKMIKQGLIQRDKAEKIFGATLFSTYDLMSNKKKREFENA